LFFDTVSSQNGSPRGAGFIEFETAEEAAAFVDSDVQDPIFLLDKNLFMQHADFSINPHREPSATLVAQHFDIGSEDFVRGLFSEYADSLVGVRIREYLVSPICYVVYDCIVQRS